MAGTKYTGVYEEQGKLGVTVIKIKFSVNGKQKKETLGVKGALVQRGNDSLKLDAKTASLIRSDRLTQVARGGEEVLQRQKPAPTFQEVWDSLSAVIKGDAGYQPLKSWWNKYVSRWADVRLDQVDEKDISTAVDQWGSDSAYFTQYKKPPGTTTINHVKKLMLQMYTHARENRTYYGRVPLSGAKRNQGKIKILSNAKLNNEKLRYFEPQEAYNILEWLWANDKTCWLQCTLSMLTGARKAEICGAKRKDYKHHGLRWRDIDWANNRITLLRKGGRYQTISVDPEVIRALKRFPIGAPNARITGPGYHKKATWNRCRKELGINPEGTSDLEKATFHSWRHTYATWYINHGGNIKDLCVLMNHHDISVTARYIKSSTEGQIQGTAAVASVLRDLEKAKFKVVSKSN